MWLWSTRHAQHGMVDVTWWGLSLLMAWHPCHRGVVVEVASSSSWRQRHGGSRCGVMSLMQRCSTTGCRAESMRWEGGVSALSIAELAGAQRDSPGQYPSLVVIVRRMVVVVVNVVWSTWHESTRWGGSVHCALLSWQGHGVTHLGNTPPHCHCCCRPLHGCGCG